MTIFFAIPAQATPRRLRKTLGLVLGFIRQAFSPIQPAADLIAELENSRAVVRSHYLSAKKHGRSEALFAHLKDITTAALMAEVDR